MPVSQAQIAPPLVTSAWFNSAPLSLDALRGRIIVLGSFQMLCPGCVTNGLPQLQRVHDSFDRKQVQVIGLHTVFEHHAAMTPVSLEAFLHEYQRFCPWEASKSAMRSEKSQDCPGP